MNSYGVDRYVYFFNVHDRQLWRPSTARSCGNSLVLSLPTCLRSPTCPSSGLRISCCGGESWPTTWSSSWETSTLPPWTPSCAGGRGSGVEWFAMHRSSVADQDSKPETQLRDTKWDREEVWWSSGLCPCLGSSLEKMRSGPDYCYQKAMKIRTHRDIVLCFLYRLFILSCNHLLYPRSLASVNYDGRLFDCDFNQQLDLTILGSSSHHNTRPTTNTTVFQLGQ